MFKKMPWIVFLLLLSTSSAFAFDFQNTCGWIHFKAGHSRTIYMKHAGEWRTYRLYVPANYQPGAALVLDFHGQTSSQSSEMAYSCWKDLANEKGAVIAYPQALGIPSTWDGGDYCCNPRGHDDEGFALALVQCLSNVKKSGLVLDEKKVYAAGFSNGAAMAGKLACDHSDVFSGAAVASQGFPYYSSASCRTVDAAGNRKSAFPVVELRGKRDFLVPYRFSFGWSPKAEFSVQRWAASNRCSGQGRVIDACDQAASGTDCRWGEGTCITYDNCENGVTVTQCGVNDDHLVFDNPQQLNFCHAAWDAFQKPRE